MWSFAVPLLLAKLFDNLLPSALFATISQLACVLFGAYVGQWIDKFQRIKLMRVALFLQNGCVVAAFVLLIIISYIFSDRNNSVSSIWKDARFVVLFLSAVLLGAVASVASMICSIAITKDWVIVIQKEHPYMPLHQVNATCRRIDLVCKLASPLAFALFLSLTSTYTSLIIVSVWNAVSLIPEYSCYQWLYKNVHTLTEPKPPSTNVRSNPFYTIYHGWKEYYNQPILRSSLAYVLLYLTVLSPGGTMTAYLEFSNLHELEIAIFTAASALFGLFATFIAPKLIESHGLRNTGLGALWFQISLVSLTLVPFVIHGSVVIMVSAIAVSRIGLWAFDLVEVQFMQTYVPEDKRGVISSVEYSLCNLISVVAYGLGIIWPNVSQFVILVGISVGSVLSAVLLYTSWYLWPPITVLAIEADIAAKKAEQEAHNV